MFETVLLCRQRNCHADDDGSMTEVSWLHFLAVVETASSHYRLQFIVMT